MFRRASTALLALICAAALVLLGWWAGRTALEPPSDPLAAPAPVSIEVVAGRVGRSLPLSATARWEAAASVRAPVGGIVTSVDVDTSRPVPEGERLASVNLVPVFAAVGNTPVFRTLAPGMSGPDVHQLEAFLARSGFEPGLLDGSYSATTALAVRAWQQASGATVTGTVELGSLVFVPALPARVRPLVAVGDTVGAGQPMMEIVEDAPMFTVAVTDEQVSLIPRGAKVRVSGARGTWAARSGRLTTTPEGTKVLRLRGVGGRPVCQRACEAVPIVGQSVWSAAVVIVPTVRGPVVPVGAVRTAPDGARFVVTDGGMEVPVEVRASADGQAVVEGVAVGSRVLLPGTPPP